MTERADSEPRARPEGREPDAPLLRRVRWRLALLSGGATLATLLLLGLLLYATVSTSLAAAGERQLREQAERGFAAASEAARERGDRPFGAGDRGRHGFPLGRPIFGGPDSGTLAVVVRPDGTLLDPDTNVTEGLPLESALAAATSSGATDLRTTSHDGTPVRVLTRPIQLPSGTWAIQILQDRTAEVRTLRPLLLGLVLGGAAVVAASVLFGFAYAGRALVPIRESLRRQREFAADASHELRTPLTVIRGSVDHLRRNPDRRVSEVGTALDDIEAEAQQLGGLVDDLLLLARADSGVIELRRQPVDAAEVAGLAMRSLRDAAGRRRISLRLDAEPAMVDADPERLRHLVGILVDNAIRHSPEGASVEVSVSRQRDRVRLVVDDHGAGIRPEHLDRVFDRFWRAPDAPPDGTGLGLAIARWIVDRHGGSITAANRPAGGARFEVLLPAV